MIVSIKCQKLLLLNRMFKRVFCILFCLLFCITVNSQNYFVYLRFERSTDNVYLLKRKVTQLRAECDGNFIFYYDGKFYRNNEVDILFAQKIFLQNVCNYNPVQENDVLSIFFDEMLHENVSKDCLLRGTEDKYWNLIFITHIDDNRNDLCRLIDIHSFNKRKVALSFINYTTETSFEQQTLPSYSEEVQMLNFK